MSDEEFNQAEALLEKEIDEGEWDGVLHPEPPPQRDHSSFLVGYLAGMRRVLHDLRHIRENKAANDAATETWRKLQY